MNEFREITPPKEMSDAMPDTAVADALREIGFSNDLNAQDASWIENLFRRIVESVTDIFDSSKQGYDTERIIPGEAAAISDEAAMDHDIAEATEEWHVQDGDNSCAVCSQQFIINEFLDLDVTEEQLCTIAEASGWFDPEQGTAPAHVDDLLELFGIDSRMNYEGSFEDLKNTLDEGGRAIVAVDSMVLWVDGAGNYPIYGADHAIEVVGIDDADPTHVKVIINDSGVEDGCGKAVPLDEFMEAWLPSGGFMVSAYPKDGTTGGEKR